MKRKIGDKIRKIRKQQPGNLSMEEFGKLFNPPASKGVVSNWENNYNYPNNERLNKIAELGKTTVEELLYGKKLEIQSFNTGAEFEASRERILKEYKLNEISNRRNMLYNDYVRSLVNIGEEKLFRLLPAKIIKELENKIYSSLDLDAHNEDNTDDLFQIEMDSFCLSIALLDDNSSKLLSNFSIISKDEQELILKLLDSMIKN